MNRRPDSRLAALGLFSVTLALYVVTLSPSLNWGDGGRLQLDIVLGGSNYWFLPELHGAPLDHWPFARLGVAPWDHPLYVMLGQLALAMPVGKALWRLNLLSAVAAAATIAMVFRLSVSLGVRRGPSALGALALGVSHTFWFHAVTTEVLALHSLFMVSLIGLALRWSVSQKAADIRLFALLAGAGLANHLMLGLTLLPTVVYLILLTDASTGLRERPEPLFVRYGVPSALFLLGLAPWWLQFLRVVRVAGVRLAIEGVTWLPTAPLASMLHPWQELAIHLLSYAGWLTYQFSPLGVCLGVVGFLKLVRTRPPFAALLVALYTVHLAFSVRYPVTDRFAFHLPSYVVFALCLGMGAQVALDEVAKKSSRRSGYVLRLASLVFALMAGPIALYAAAPRALRALGVTDADFSIPDIGFGTRDGLSYLLNPPKGGDHSAIRFAKSTLGQLASRAVVLAPEPYLEVSIVTRYLQHAEGLRPDVYVDPLVFVPRAHLEGSLVTAAERFARCRPVYIAALPVNLRQRMILLTTFSVTEEAELYRLLPRHLLPGASCPLVFRPRTLPALIRSAFND